MFGRQARQICSGPVLAVRAGAVFSESRLDNPVPGRWRAFLALLVAISGGRSQGKKKRGSLEPR
jgi:hypothetical protein